MNNKDAKIGKPLADALQELWDPDFIIDQMMEQDLERLAEDQELALSMLIEDDSFEQDCAQMRCTYGN